MLAIYLQGFFLQASLILALGAQNIFVMESGLRKRHHLLVASVCSACDALLVFVGVLGVASVFVQVPALKIGLGVVGVGFLLFYGLLKLREAASGGKVPAGHAAAPTRREAVLTALGFSLLNPHVYLDTVVLVGGYSARFLPFSERFYFGLGSASFSTVWFFALALLSAFGANALNNPRAMRIISLLSGLVLVGLAVKLGSDVLAWLPAETGLRMPRGH